MEVIGSASHEKAGLICRGWWWFKALVVGVATKTMKLGRDDPRRVIHALKVGLALSFVSLFYYFRPLYNGFGDATMWAVLTVVVVFEYTVGATLGKGLNRGLATLLAGALGVGAHHLATLSGEKGAPMVLSIFIFILAAAATFSRFFPGIKARYDYGVVIFILTFSLVSVSGYHADKILQLARQRLSTILMGGCICLIISIFICPVWAGQDLHNLIALNMEKLADFLEGFGGEYFESDHGDEKSASDGSKSDKSFLQGYKSVLNSKATEESLANFARWEPCHGFFRFFHPWDQYLKVGSLIRQCSYRIEALSDYINSDIQAPLEFKKEIQGACIKMSSESGKALRELASGVRTMTQNGSTDIHIANSKNAANDLKSVLKSTLTKNADLLQIMPAATASALLVEIIKCIEEIAESVNELGRSTKFKIVDPTLTALEIKQQPQTLLHRGIVNPLDTDCPHIFIEVDGPSDLSPPGNVNSKVPGGGASTSN
ncbi:hypothetical protein Syun_002442 [Stephania yunnanensis]|uniref:Aluminum-activated malate transporter n=1 Tax=Stephania yunnanensis TaxID=152371 RepID=A0AAP0Q767_9MAGN